MKTCTNGLPCPTQLQCGIGCFFNEADTNYFQAMNAPMHSKNGGNVIDHGEALERVDHDLRRHVWIGLLAYGAVFLACVVVLAYQVLS